MLVTQTTVVNIPVSLSTVLTIRENNSWQRSLYFKNLSASTLAIQLETSADGGTTWSIIGTAFSLAAGESIAKEISAAYPYILRIRASGGGSDRDLYIGYARMFADGANWTNPTV